VLADSPLAHWRLDEASGATSAADASGNGNAATPESGLVFGGSGLIFNDSGARTGGSVSFPATKVLNTPVTAGGRTALSVEAWVTRTPDGVDGVFDLGTSAGRLYFGSSSDPNLHWKVAGADVTFPYGTAMSSGTQYHLVGTWDGTTARLYLNGAQVASGATTASSLPTGTVTVGQGGGAFKGRIDEPAVYGAALSAARVLDHFGSGNRAPETDLSAYGEAVLESEPLGYWPLDEATSSVHPADLSGNARHAVARSGAVLGGPGLVYDPDGTITDGAASYATTASTEPESRVTAPVGLTGATAVSVEAWVQRDPSNADTLVDLGASVGSLGFTSSTGSGLRWAVAGATVSYAWAKLTAGATYHVVGTWDGTTARLFINGTEVASAASTASSLAASAEVTVGNVGAGSSPHHGAIDEVAVYGAALDQPSIAAHFNAGWSGGSAAANAYSPAVTRDGPVGYWQLDEAPGAGRARDSSGGGWHAAVSSGAVLGADGLVNAADGTTTGTALQRTSSNATGADARVLSPLNLQGTTALTVEAWVQRQHHETDTIVDAGGEVVLRFSGGDTLTFTVGGSSVSIPFAGFFPDSIAAPPRGTYHIVGTWDGAALELFVNGQLVASGTGASGALAGGPDLSIGSSAGGTNVFRGNVDEVAIYDTVLAPERVAAHWLRGRRTELPPPNARFAGANSLGPVGYWQFDEGADAEEAVDSTGHGRHAQVLPNVHSDVAEPGAWERRAFDWTTDGGDDDTDARVFAPVSMAGWDEFTLTGWIDRESPSASATLFHQQSGALLQFNNDDLIFGVDDQLTTWDCGTGDCPTLGHIAMTWDGTTATVYWQGDPLTSATAAATLTDAGPELVIGGTRGGSRDYDGRIDEVAVFDRALTAGEIGEISAADDPEGGPILASERFGGCGCTPATTASAADPVDTWSGNFWRSSEDLAIPGRGPALSFTRTYNSLDAAASGELGYGWQHPYASTLDIGTGTVVVRQGSGAQVVFDLQGSDWVAAPRVQATLEHNGDGTWTFTRGLREVFTYDSSGRLIAIGDLNGETTTIDHPSATSRVITDPAGREVTATLSGGRITQIQDETSRTVSYSYDGQGNLAAVTDAEGGVSSFTYDANHRLLTWRTPRFDGDSTTPAPVVSNHYDTEGRVDQQTDATGAETSFDYTTVEDATIVTDPEGNATLHVYEEGLLIGTTTGYGTPDAATSTFAYDPTTTTRTAVTDPLGNSSRSTYDSDGNPTSQVDPLGRETAITYNSLGLPITVTDPAGTVTTSTYDTAGNLLSTSTPLTGSSPPSARTVTFSHSDTSHPGDVTSVTDPLGNDWDIDYDADGNVTSTTDPLANAARSCYDPAGRLTRSISAAGVDAGETCSATSPSHSTLYTHNAFGDVLTVTDPLGGVTTTTYDANRNVTSVQNPNGNTTSYAYDAADRLVETTNPDDTTASFGYDANGNRVSATDGEGNTTTYTYGDPAFPGSATEVTDPNERATSSFLDRAGRTTALQQPGGDCGSATAAGCIETTYDAAGQATAVQYSAPGTPDISTIEYDALGRATEMTDSTSLTLAWAYDSLGRLTSSTDGAATTTYSHDLAGAVTAIAYPGSGHTVARSYDDAGRLVSSADWNNEETSFGYDLDGNLTEVVYPTGDQVDEFTYDLAQRMETVTATAGTSTVATIDYARDDAGQLAGEDQTGLPGSDRTWAYDELERLAEEDASATWNYDQADNLTLTSGGSVQVFDDANQLCSAAPTAGTCATPASGATVHTYDDRGNRTETDPDAGATVTYSYDQADRLTGVDTGAAVTDITYRPDGLRSATDDGTHDLAFTWDQSSEIPMLLTEADGSDLTHYLYGPGGFPYAEIAPDGAVTYLHHDQLGSVRLLTDPSGDTTGSVTYDPYGAVSASTGEQSAMGFAGQYTDPTGLQYLRARYYDPDTGQFLTRDPLEASTGQPYAYAGNTPLNATDPSGLMPCIMGFGDCQNDDDYTGNVVAEIHFKGDSVIVLFGANGWRRTDSLTMDLTVWRNGEPVWTDQRTCLNPNGCEEFTPRSILFDCESDSEDVWTVFVEVDSVYGREHRDDQRSRAGPSLVDGISDWLIGGPFL
jgi:RHS repeat-associated protein